MNNELEIKENPLSVWFYISLFLGGVVLLVIYVLLSSSYPNLGLWWTIVENTSLALMLGVILSFTFEKWHYLRVEQITNKVDEKIDQLDKNSTNKIETLKSLTPQKFLESLFPDLKGVLDMIRDRIIDSSFIYEKCTDTINLEIKEDQKNILFEKETRIEVKNRASATRTYQVRKYSSVLGEPDANTKIIMVEIYDPAKTLKIVIDVEKQKIIEEKPGTTKERNFQEIDKEILSIEEQKSKNEHYIQLTYNYNVDPNSNITVKIKSQQTLQTTDTYISRFNYVTLSTIVFVTYDKKRIELGFEPIHPYLHAIPNNQLWEHLADNGWEILKPLIPANGYSLQWNIKQPPT